ncbi:MAG: hypothetical protein JEZ09_04235 [Salinivirgaceae bacterium]|nr:hypothetical protein [Salinivirgaceae bacterium]
MKKNLLGLGLSVLFMTFFVACDVENISTTADNLENSKGTLAENANAEVGVIKVFENVNNFGFNSDGLKSFESGDPIETWDSTHTVMTLDFSNTSNSSGKVIVEFSAYPVYQTGLTADVTFENYESEGVGINGDLKFIVVAYTESQSVMFAMEAPEYLTITENGASYDWLCNQTVLWETGFGTLDSADDLFIINGTSMQQIDGLTNKTTLDDINYASSCEFMLDGELELIKDYEGDNSFTINCDFGAGPDSSIEGECDGWVLLTANGFTLRVNLE